MSHDKWLSSASRKMIFPGLVLTLIFIRHAAGSHQNQDFGSRLSFSDRKEQRHPTIHQHREQLTPHPHRHHHENMFQSNREVHIKPSQRYHGYNERDFRATRTTTTRTLPQMVNIQSMPWKWTPTIAAANVRADLTHVKHQGANKTSAGMPATSKSRLIEGGEREKSILSNKQSITEPEPSWMLRSSKGNHRHDLGRSSWWHDTKITAVEQAGKKNHHTTIGRGSRIIDGDHGKISHEDPRVTSPPDNKENFDFYNRNERLAENKIDETKELADDYDYLEDDPDIQNEDPDQNSYKPGSLTEEKWKNYGTREAVKKSHQLYYEEQSQARAHIQRINEESKCRWPHPKVIPVTEASKRFVPHCTILHRCGDDTGCCDYDTKTCVAKSTATVHLHFFVIPLGGSASVEVRSFVNHTECHCVDRCLLSSCANNNDFSLIGYGNVAGLPPTNASESCQCPSQFDIDQEEFSRGRCQCDCFGGSSTCNSLKRGLNDFSNEDQKCISDNKCQKPECQYGHYNTYSGRCPQVKHHKRTISRYDYR